MRSGRPRGTKETRTRAHNLLVRTEEWKLYARAFGERIRVRRLAAKLTACGAGQLLGVNAHTMSSWERGRSVPSPPMQYLIARLLGCSVADLQPNITVTQGGATDWLVSPALGENP